MIRDLTYAQVGELVELLTSYLQKWESVSNAVRAATATEAARSAYLAAMPQLSDDDAVLALLAREHAIRQVTAEGLEAAHATTAEAIDGLLGALVSGGADVHHPPLVTGGNGSEPESAAVVEVPPATVVVEGIASAGPSADAPGLPASDDSGADGSEPFAWSLSDLNDEDESVEPAPEFEDDELGGDTLFGEVDESTGGGAIWMQILSEGTTP